MELLFGFKQSLWYIERELIFAIGFHLLDGYETPIRKIVNVIRKFPETYLNTVFHPI